MHGFYSPGKDRQKETRGRRDRKRHWKGQTETCRLRQRKDKKRIEKEKGKKQQRKEVQDVKQKIRTKEYR